MVNRVTVTSESNPDLTTTATVKTELSITSTTDDAFLSALIKQASDFVVAYTGRTFHKVAVTETLDSKGGVKLVLARAPIISITQVRDDGTAINSTEYSIDDPDAGIVWNEEVWDSTLIKSHYVEDYSLHEGARDWAFDYVAGYVTPAEAESTSSTFGSRTLPRDIERAAIDLVKTYYNRRKEDPLLRGQTVGDASETLFDGSGIPPSVSAVLDRWTRIY